MTLVTDDKRTRFQRYASEFKIEYLDKEIGQEHLAAYKTEREEVTRFWKEIKEADKAGEPITDMVLEKLLPYRNTRHNREKGYRVSIAPAITRDIKKWFENAGWRQTGDWEPVARAIYELVDGLIEKHDWDSLLAFEQKRDISKGIRAGFITPTFYALDRRYRTINNKTIDTVNFLLGPNAIDRYLSNYKHHLETINQAVDDLNIPLLADSDVFDAFCHWMCDRRLGGYARGYRS